MSAVGGLRQRAWLGCVALCLAALVSSALADDSRSGRDYLNSLRQQAGLSALAANTLLNRTAKAHADYLNRHAEAERDLPGGSGHYETRWRSGFTGKTALERSATQGYPHTAVSENVSSGQRDYVESIDGLMGAIYHRFGFLDFEVDEIGVASNAEHFVYVTGRRDLRALCRNPDSDALAVAMVKCGNTRVSSRWLEGLCDRLPATALFREAWPLACPNGQRLDATYMTGFCGNPPAAAEARRGESYYALCDGEVKVAARWFDRLCDDPPPAAAHAGGNRYIDMCQPAQRVRMEWLEHECALSSNAARPVDGGYYLKLCRDSGVKLRESALQALNTKRYRQSPDYVLWPPKGARGIPAAFFDENPDPLPDREISGYPVSIQFNPAMVSDLHLHEFELYKRERAGWQQVAPTRLLDQQSDPHGRFTDLQFALFPLERLEWGKTYQARVRFRADGEERRISWSFTVSQPGKPLFTVNSIKQRFRVARGDRPVVFVPPRGNVRTVGGATIEYFEPTSVATSEIDPNAMRLTIDWHDCQPVTLKFVDGRSAVISRIDCR